MDEVQTCPVCKNPRKSDGSGSLTQWIVTCECDLDTLRESAQGLTSSVCSRCGKRTREALPGSISQFIFSSDCCSCSQEELQNHVDEGASNSLPDEDLNVLLDEGNLVTDGAQKQDELSRLKNGDETNTADHNSVVLSSIQKSILGAASAKRLESAPRNSTALILVGGVLLILLCALGANMSGLLQSRDLVVSEKYKAPDETLGDRMRMYEDEKWTLLAKNGIPFHDGGPDIVDEDFAVLNDQKDVRSIRLLRSEKVTGAGLGLVKNTQIFSMGLNSREFSDEGMKFIPRFKSLEFLTLGWFSHVTKSGLSKLEGLPNLKELMFNHAKLPDNALLVASKIKTLEKLGISVCENLQHEDLRALSNLPELRSLVLIAENIVDADCIEISRLMQLQELDVRENKITDAGIGQLSKMPLVFLDVSGNDISDRSLSELTKIKTLKKLVIADCPRLTSRAKSAFQISLPRCLLSESLHGKESF